MFPYDGEGVDASNSFPVIPGRKVWNTFEITEAREMKSKDKGYDQVMVKAECVDSKEHPEWNGIEVLHYVTFIPKGQKGAGIALSFLAAIDEPHEGKFNVDPFGWEGKRFKGCTIVSEYNGKTNNKFVDWMICDEGAESHRAAHGQPPVAAAAAPAQEDDRVPF